MLPYFSIFIATCAGFLVGFVWYSPYICMNLWLKGKGVTKETLPVRSRTYIAQTNVYSFIAHLCIALTLSVVFTLLSVKDVKTAVTLGTLLAFGFIVSSRFVDMLYTVDGVHYDKKNQSLFLVTSGYYITTVAVMSYTLAVLSIL